VSVTPIRQFAETLGIAPVVIKHNGAIYISIDKTNDYRTIRVEPVPSRMFDQCYVRIVCGDIDTVVKVEMDNKENQARWVFWPSPATRVMRDNAIGQ